MDNNCKKIHFTHHELLELLAIVQAIKCAAAQQHNKPEVKLMNELTSKLLSFDLDRNGTMVEADRMMRFSLWMCVEKYISFCSDTKQYDEYSLAVTLATKLSG